MHTYFARHTSKLDVDEATLSELWESRRIGIHYPENGTVLEESDFDGIDPEQYVGPARKAMNTLSELATAGGYVCAQYRGIDAIVVGRVSPGSPIELLAGRWGNLNRRTGRVALLKTVQLQQTRVIEPANCPAVLVGRPRMGTLSRWPRAGAVIANIIEGKGQQSGASGLFPPQQEALCSEFLRLPDADKLGLPTLAHLILPIGRTMKDIDIYGLATDGRRIIAQVTSLAARQSGPKAESLRRYRGPDVYLVLFCATERVHTTDDVIFVPIELAVERFALSKYGREWWPFALYSSGGVEADNITE